MKHFIPILFALVTAVVCNLLVPPPADARKGTSGVAVKQDGDTVVLIPTVAGKAFLVLCYPRDEKGKEPVTGSASLIPYFEGEQRIPAKECSKMVLLEVRNPIEVKLELGPAGVAVRESKVKLPCMNKVCVKPLPPPPPSSPNVGPVKSSLLLPAGIEGGTQAGKLVSQPLQYE